MHRPLLTFVVAPLAALSLVVTSGCLALAAGAAAGAGTYAWIQGEMTTTFEAPLDRVYAAAQRAVRDLEFDIDTESSDALQARIRVHQADGTPIRIALERQTETLTDARVRVGVFGNEAKSRIVLNRIRDNLADQQ